MDFSLEILEILLCFKLLLQGMMANISELFLNAFNLLFLLSLKLLLSSLNLVNHLIEDHACFIFSNHFLGQKKFHKFLLILTIIINFIKLTFFKNCNLLNHLILGELHLIKSLQTCTSSFFSSSVLSRKIIKRRVCMFFLVILAMLVMASLAQGHLAQVTIADDLFFWVIMTLKV